MIGLNPNMGRERHELPDPIRTVPITSHIILYQIEPDQSITILRIRHMAEDLINLT